MLSISAAKALWQVSSLQGPVVTLGLLFAVLILILLAALLVALWK